MKPKILPENYDPRFFMHDASVSFTKEAIKQVKEERREIEELKQKLFNLKYGFQVKYQ